MSGARQPSVDWQRRNLPARRAHYLLLPARQARCAAPPLWSPSWQSSSSCGARRAPRRLATTMRPRGWPIATCRFGGIRPCRFSSNFFGPTEISGRCTTTRGTRRSSTLCLDFPRQWLMLAAS